LAAG
jgi:hypothetical protein